MSLAQRGCLNERYLMDVKRESRVRWLLQSQYLSSEYGRADLYLPTWVDESLTIISIGYFQDGLVIDWISKHNRMPE